MKQQIKVLSLMAWLFATVCLQVQAQGVLPDIDTGANKRASMSDIAIDYGEGMLLTDAQVIAVADDDGALRDSRREDRRQRRDTGNHRVAIGSNADLPAGETSDAVVAIAGDANVAGDVHDAVVAIMGNTMVDGNVGESVVTLFGNSYVNSRVGEGVVTIFGNVELGPQAVIEGELVTIGGTVKRDPAAIVNRTQSIKGLPFSVDFGWFRTWVKECVLYGRLLAFHPDLMWAWGVALVTLLLYVLTAAMMPQTMSKCVNTLETWPGRSLLAALLSIPLIPILLLLLVITIIGMLAIPVVGLALLTASWFGKLIMLGWIGKRLMQALRMQQVNWALAVLIGGMVATLLYTIPVIGLLSYKLLQFIGFGAVLYTVLLMFQKPALQAGISSAMPAGGTAPNARQEFNTSQAGDVHGDMHLHVADELDTAAQFTQTGAAPPAHAGAQPTAAVALTYPRAGFGIRMAALFVDALLMMIVIEALYTHNTPKPVLILLAVYGAIMWKLKGSTIGGIVCRLQVVRMDTRELDWPTAIVRALSCFLSLFMGGLGFLWIAFDQDKQAWHDKLAGTVVVRVPKVQSLV